MGDGDETGKNGNKGATARQDEETGDPARTAKLAEIQSLEAALRDAREAIGEPAGNTSNDAVKAIIKGQTDRHTEEIIRENLKTAASMIEPCDGSSQDNVRRWFEDVEMGAYMVGAGNQLRLARRTVAGSFRRELEKYLQRLPLSSWDDVKKAMTTRFLSMDEAGHMKGKLEKTRQGEKEEVPAFNRRFSSMADVAYPLGRNGRRSEETEGILVRMYARAIRSDHHAKKLATKEPRVTTLDDAMELVMKMEGATEKYDLLGRNSDTAVSTVSLKSLGESGVELKTLKNEVSRLANVLSAQKGQAKHQNKASSQKRSQKETSGGDTGRGNKPYRRPGGPRNQSQGQKPHWKDGQPLCFVCDEYGHMKKDCRLTKKDSSVNSTAGIQWS